MALFDATAERYDDWCRTPLGAMVQAYEATVVESMLPPSVEGLKVLDVGCGTGTWALHLAARGARVSGVDQSEGMIRVARRKSTVSGLPVPFQIADGARLPFGAATFDLVTALLVLEFAHQPGAVVAEMARVLRPGGTALVATLNRHSVWTLLRRLEGRRRPTVYNSARFLTGRDLEGLLTREGLVPRARRAAIYFPPLSAPWARPALELLEAAGRKGLGFGPAFLAVQAVRPSK